jgi:DMSO/TMAO reductase YedYZ heme-binding membrane subunit
MKSKTEAFVKWGIIGGAILLPLFPIMSWFFAVERMYRSIRHIPMLTIYLPARVLGLVGFVLMFYQFILAARFPIIEKLFTRVVLYRKHKTLGMIGFLLMLIHGLGMIVFDLLVDGEIFGEPAKVVGIIALLLISLAVVVAIWWKPLKLSQKQWMAIHRIAWLVLPLSLYHALSLGTTLQASQPLRSLYWSLGIIYCILLVRRLLQAGKKYKNARIPKS